MDGGAFGGSGLDSSILRMFMRGAGYSETMVTRRPVIGICNSWSELNPCNGGLRDLAEAVKRGVFAAGGFPLEFPTISLAEPFIRPSSLFLRNLMAMDVEEMILASPVDGVVLLGGCDKTIPAQLMGALSAGKPAIVLAAGPRAAGRWRDRVLTIDDLWQLADERRRGQLSDDDWRTIEERMNGSVGTCNVMGTATTMAVVSEVMGMSLPSTALLPATSAGRRDAAERTGARAVEMVQEGVSPSQCVTRNALENALRVVTAVGGSTNALIHLEAVAGRLCTRLGLDLVTKVASETPLIADVRPSGRYSLEDLSAAGGVPAIMRELGDLIDGSQLTASGMQWAEIIATIPSESHPVLRSRDEPKEPAGGIVALRGSLAPRGAVIKRSAADARLLQHRGPAVVFDDVDDLRRRIDAPELDVTPDSVLVLRGVGPVGGPGMPEVGAIPIPKRLLSAGIKDMLRISDARMSGTAVGAVVLHVSPEGAIGGPLGLVRDGDLIDLDVDAGRLDLLVDGPELTRRSAAVTKRPGPARGFELLHQMHVLQADEGCDFDFLAGARSGETRG